MAAVSGRPILPLRRHKFFVFAEQKEFSPAAPFATSEEQPMDFFDQEARAKKRTRRLLGLFGLAVLSFVVLTYFILAAPILIFSKPLPRSLPGFFQWLWDAQLAGWIVFCSVISISLGCLYKMRRLSGGGSAVAELLGGRTIEPNTSDPDEQRLRNVVAEMAIASGSPVPEIYLLDNERGINSFAAGHSRDDVAIGVTRGCLKLLTRDELQGVIAHEFSHVLNGDTRLNMKLMALAHGLFWPTIAGRILVRGSTQAPEIGESIFDADEDHYFLPTAPVGILFLLVGSVSLPFVRLLKSAICREREWLADAAAVQFTRNPAGIEGALKKIGGLYKQGRLDTPRAETASHLYFSNSDYDPWFDFLSTHPPLAKRILAIDPLFDGQLPRVKTLPPNQFERDQAYEQVVATTISIGQKYPESLVEEMGCMTADRIKRAATMRLNLPDEVTQALREPAGAAGVVYALLLGADAATRRQQLQILGGQTAPVVFEKTKTLAPQIEALGDSYKFVLAEIAAPTLRRLDSDEYTAFARNIRQLVECDGVVELFEYALMKMVARRLNASFGDSDAEETPYGRVTDVLPECATLLSALAHVGEEDELKARAAFAKGREFLNAPPGSVQFLTRSEWDLAKVDAALARLTKISLAVQRNIMLACGKTVAADGCVTVREAELLRAIADSLNCPMPPFVDAIRMEELAKEQ